MPCRPGCAACRFCSCCQRQRGTTAKSGGCRNHRRSQRCHSAGVVAGQRLVAPAAPAAVAVGFAFQRVQRGIQCSVILRGRTEEPSLEHQQVQWRVQVRPLRLGQAFIGQLVKARHRQGAARCNGVQHAVRQRQVMGTGRAAGHQQRMHLARQALALRTGQVDIVDRQAGRAQAAGPGACDHLCGQRRFAAPLQAADRQYWNRCTAGQCIVQRLFGQCFGESFHLGHIRSSGHAATIAQTV